MTVSRHTEPSTGIEYLSATDSDLAVAIDYTPRLQAIEDGLAAITDQFTTANTHLSGLLEQATIANTHFAAMVQQLTRIANCTCTPCSNIDMCEVVETVLRKDGIIS